ncbi:MAG TPA: hypothetical protein VGE07_02890, partial [Herpetosiphonaceae bacterium]
TIALLWSSNPNLIGDLAATQRLLTETGEPAYSTECGDLPGARPNNVYGWGRLDAWRAVRAARVDVPWLEAPTSVAFPAGAPAALQLTLDARQVPGPGRYTARLVVQRPGGQDTYPVIFDVTPSANTTHVQGRLVDRWSGNGVYGRLQFGGGPLIQTTLSGAYSATLPFGAYPLTASAAGYLPLLTALAVPQQPTRVLTITPDIPHLALTAPPLSATLSPGQRRDVLIGVANQGSQELTLRAVVPRLDWSVADSLAGGPTGPLYDLSAFPPLPLGDDQVYTDTLDLGFSIPAGNGFVSEWYVSSNGWVSASEPLNAVSGAGCLPTFNLPDDSFAAFWADLDPSRGGSIRAGQVNADTFVVSYERVPMFSSQPLRPDEPTFTFQIIARSSGEVQFRYGQMGALPQRWAVGAIPADSGGQSIACHAMSQALPARTWTLLKQPPAPIWLEIDPEDELEIPPGGQAVITATLRGAGYAPWRLGPLRGRIELATNDPRQLWASLDARLTLLAPAFQAWIPNLRR